MGKGCLLCSNSIPPSGCLECLHCGWCSAAVLAHEVAMRVEAIHGIAEIGKVCGL